MSRPPGARAPPPCSASPKWRRTALQLGPTLFRLPEPERFVGVLVEPELRGDWTLKMEGDETNLPAILAEVPQVDIFHYDSDKMRSGREFAISLVQDKLGPDGIIVMDDIHNDDWFKYHVTERGLPFAVVEGRPGGPSARWTGRRRTIEPAPR